MAMEGKREQKKINVERKGKGREINGTEGKGLHKKRKGWQK